MPKAVCDSLVGEIETAVCTALTDSSVQIKCNDEQWSEFVTKAVRQLRKRGLGIIPTKEKRAVVARQARIHRPKRRTLRF